MKKIEDISKSYLDWAPLSLTIREVSRINALRLLDEKENIFQGRNILDVGCGDGKWWLHVLPDNLEKIHGIDINPQEIELAQKVISSQCLDITSPDFLNQLKIKEFDLIIGNCSLEHVFHLDKALRNIHSILAKDGIFILLVPTPYWALKGHGVGLLKSLSPRLSLAFSGLMNGFFQHWHLYNYKLWNSLLEGLGFKPKTAYGLGNKKSEFLFRLGLPTAFISFLVKCLTGKYLNFYLAAFTPDSLKNKIALSLCDSLDHHLVEPNADDIFEYLIVCKK